MFGANEMSDVNQGTNSTQISEYGSGSLLSYSEGSFLDTANAQLELLDLAELHNMKEVYVQLLSHRTELNCAVYILDNPIAHADPKSAM